MPALPNVVEVVRSGDFEATVSHGIGVVQRRAVTVITLTGPEPRRRRHRRPERDLACRAVHLLDVADFAEGNEPYTEPVLRRVPARRRPARCCTTCSPGRPWPSRRSGSRPSGPARGFRDLTIRTASPGCA